MNEYVKNIMIGVAEFYALPVGFLTCNVRKREYIEATRIAMYLIYESGISNYRYIANCFNRKNYRSAIIGIQYVYNQIDVNKIYARRIELIKDQIFNRAREDDYTTVYQENDFYPLKYVS